MLVLVRTFVLTVDKRGAHMEQIVYLSIVNGNDEICGSDCGKPVSLKLKVRYIP
jgi:hypothetical protein